MDITIDNNTINVDYQEALGRLEGFVFEFNGYAEVKDFQFGPSDLHSN